MLPASVFFLAETRDGDWSVGRFGIPDAGYRVANYRRVGLRLSVQPDRGECTAVESIKRQDRLTAVVLLVFLWASYQSLRFSYIFCSLKIEQASDLGCSMALM